MAHHVLVLFSPHRRIRRSKPRSERKNIVDLGELGDAVLRLGGKQTGFKITDSKTMTVHIFCSLDFYFCDANGFLIHFQSSFKPGEGEGGGRVGFGAALGHRREAPRR